MQDDTVTKFADTLALLRANAEAEIARIGGFSKGEVGVAACHLGTALELAVADTFRYPPASTVKLPLALTVLDRVDRGLLRLDDMIEVQQEEMNPAGPIGDEFLHPGVALSVLNLLEPMITRSCNTATDVLFRVVGGPGIVADYLRRVGIDDFEVRRTMREALCVLHELPLPPPGVSMRDVLRTQPFEVIDARNRENADFHHDRRDHATPRAMLGLLRRLWQGELVSAPSRDLLLDIMSRTSTSIDRAQARLPRGVAFASKGGSGAGTAVDVGYLTLPDGRGTVALAIFVKASPLDMDARNAVIADIARMVYDYFVITAG